MRELLFRGKTVDKDKWVEGWYGEKSFGAWPLRPAITPFEDARRGHLYYEEVKPDTVGQYTGLDDKNGKRIFEGDIVKVDGKHYEVQYMLGQFFVGINMPIAYKRFECEVIGNIHDDPDLIGGSNA